MQAPITIDVLVCTYERASLRPCLDRIARQILPRGVNIGVVVADNAARPKARRMVLQSLPYARYIHAPQSNISIARNALLEASQADFIAFIDDDELAPVDWVQKLYKDLGENDAVFGDVRAIYPDHTPNWIVESDFHSTSLSSEKKVLKTGHAGNVLIRWRGTPWQGERFDERLGVVGGEDTDYFYRLYRRGAKFRASSNAFVTEPVQTDRLNMSWLTKRRFRCGQSFANLKTQTASRLVISAICKAIISGTRAICVFLSPAKRRFWWLRSVFHFGVFAQSFQNAFTAQRSTR